MPMRFTELNSPNSVKAYATARAHSAEVILVGDIPSNKARELLIAAFEREVEGLITLQEAGQPFSLNEKLLEKIHRAIELREVELQAPDFNSKGYEDDQALSFLIVPKLGGQEALTKGNSGVILLSDVNVPFHTIAHELGHAGARRTFVVSNDACQLVACGLSRAGGREGRLLEELASMCLSAAALRSEQQLLESHVDFTLQLSLTAGHVIRGLVEIALSIQHPDLVKQSKGEAGDDWFEHLVELQNKQGVTSLVFTARSYAAGGQWEWSVYKTSLRALDILAAEVFPDLHPTEAADTLRKDMVFAQAYADFSPVLGWFERSFGSKAVSFFGQLEGAESKDVQLSELLLSFFAEAQQLPVSERDAVRVSVMELLESVVGKAPHITSEYAWRKGRITE